MITAKEARKVIDEGKYDKAVQQWKLIEEKILSAIENGEANIVLYGILERKNKNILEGLGYAIHVGSQYNKSYFSIAW